MEWAIDHSGTLYWLQARPITTLQHDSLDTPVAEDEILTRCNIGEMLPGAATPLTLSVFAEPLDWGLQEMSRREGVLRGLKKPPRYINHIENHLFMNLSSMYLMARRVAGATREGTELNIVEAIEEIVLSIEKSGNVDWFITTPETELLRWLETDASGETGNLFRQFLIRHGHRCIREAELRSKDYETYPVELIKIIKDTAESNRNRMDIHNVSPEAGIKTETQTEDEKEISPWLLKQAKKGVRQREYSKSMLILAQHQFKKGYRKLAGMLVNESILPDKDLIYFFTREEIGGALSHGAVVAREYGLPMISNIPGIVNLLETGKKGRFISSRT